jgi:hypothetical protein
MMQHQQWCFYLPIVTILTPVYEAITCLYSPFAPNLPIGPSSCLPDQFCLTVWVASFKLCRRISCLASLSACLCHHSHACLCADGRVGSFQWHGRDLRTMHRPLFPPMLSLLSCPGHGALGRGRAALPASAVQVVGGGVGSEREVPQGTDSPAN